MKSTKQLGFFETFDSAERVSVAKARKSDVQPSHDAAEQYESTGKADSDRAAILNVIRTVTLRTPEGYPMHGLTAGEVANCLGDGWTNVRVSRRTVELMRQGLIDRGVARECSIHRTSMSTWHPA